MTRWEEILPRVNDLLDGRLSAEEEQELRRLLEQDEECARRFHELGAILGGLARLREERVPAGFSARVLEALAAERAPGGAQGAGTARRAPLLHLLARYGALAASFVAVLAVGFLVLRSRGVEDAPSSRSQAEVAQESGARPRPEAAAPEPAARRALEDFDLPDDEEKGKVEETAERLGRLGYLGGEEEAKAPAAADREPAPADKLEEAESPAAAPEEADFQRLMRDLTGELKQLRGLGGAGEEAKKARSLRTSASGRGGPPGAPGEAGEGQAAEAMLVGLGWVGRGQVAKVLDELQDGKDADRGSAPEAALEAEADASQAAADPLAGLPPELSKPARELAARFPGRVRIVALDQAGLLRLLENTAAAGCRIEDLALSAPVGFMTGMGRLALAPDGFARVRAAAPEPRGPGGPASAGGAPAAAPAEAAAAKKDKARGGPAAPAAAERYVLILVIED
ncbi:MAG: hypothetical protein HY812_22510 [Planctomycetes bacterium]|nr:hypothetical protein [Planctomycetota bacterium]